jgi:hypothetical protein
VTVPKNKLRESPVTGGHGGGLVEVPEFSLLGSYDVEVTKGVFQGLGVLFEGLELG